jgi:putative DNA primase/helicase
VNDVVPESAEARARRRAWFETNDMGNARRLHDQADGLLLWIEDRETWAWFDGRRWSVEDGESRSVAFAHRVAAGIRDEIAALRAVPEDAVKAVLGDWCTPELVKDRILTLAKWMVASGDSSRTSAMLKQARALMIEGRIAMRARMRDFDRDPLAYNVKNGVLRFVRESADADARFVLRFDAGHRPGDMMMQIAGVDYDPDAACTQWRARLKMLQPDRQQRDELQRLYGYTLTGLIDDQSFYIQQGLGGDGKSMTHIVLRELHGDYFRSASPKTFLEGGMKSGSDHQSDIVRLMGDIRMVVADEPKDRQVWDGERIKQVTGSSITARGAHERTEVTFTPRWKLFVECNMVPRPPSDDDGFRRRMKVFPWPVQIHKTPGLSADPPLVVQERLTAELSGILNWMIEGALSFLTTRKIATTRPMDDFLGSYWAETSPIGEWFDIWCDRQDRSASVEASELYRHFSDWWVEQGRDKDKVPHQTQFGRFLTNKQIANVKGNGGRKVRKGVRLRTAAEVAAIDAGGAGGAGGPVSGAGDEDLP